MYGLSISDAEEYDGDLSTTVSIMFHDESHRKVAVDFWKFWLSQQKDPDNARAIDIGKTTLMIDNTTKPTITLYYRYHT